MDTDEKETDKVKRFSLILNEKREEQFQKLQEKYGKNTIASLIDHFLDIASTNPEKIDFTQSSNPNKDFSTYFAQHEDLERTTLDKITSLQQEVKELREHIAEIRELLALASPEVKNYIHPKRKAFFNEHDK